MATKPAKTQKTKPAAKAKVKTAASKKTKAAAPKTTAPAIKETRAGFVAIIGAPNAGKSTLLNRLIGQKISIVSPKAQTTRSRILGVLTEGDTQMGLIDTPGIFAGKSRLDRAMVDAAWQSLEDADAIVWLVDAASRQDDKLDGIIAELTRRHVRATLVLNKVDKIEAAKLLPLTQKLHDTGVADEVFMISALTGDGVDDVKKYLRAKMPTGPWLFPEDQLSDLPSRLIAAEITREQIFKQLQQELPYAATVVPETWEMRKDGSSTIRQTIVVARTGHRAIMLGKGGERIKAIGQAARREIEKFLGTRAHLFLEVKVDENWQERPDYYTMFGLNFN